MLIQIFKANMIREAGSNKKSDFERLAEVLRS